MFKFLKGLGKTWRLQSDYWLIKNVQTQSIDEHYWNKTDKIIAVYTVILETWFSPSISTHPTSAIKANWRFFFFCNSLFIVKQQYLCRTERIAYAGSKIKFKKKKFYNWFCFSIKNQHAKKCKKKLYDHKIFYKIFLPHM